MPRATRAAGDAWEQVQRVKADGADQVACEASVVEQCVEVGVHRGVGG